MPQVDHKASFLTASTSESAAPEARLPRRFFAFDRLTQPKLWLSLKLQREVPYAFSNRLSRRRHGYRRRRAATKKKGRSAYTKEQQKKFYEYALKVCRKEYGTSLHYVKVDYSTSPPRLWCYHY
jgi:hypothetical protein